MEILDTNDKFKILVETAVVGIYIIQDGKFTYVNDRLASIFGYQAEEIIGHLSPLDLTAPSDRERVVELIKKRVSGKIKSIEYTFEGLKKNGEQLYIRVLGTTIERGKHKAIIGTLIDETQQVLAEKELERLANYDSLTGLHNRNYFSLHVGHCIEKSKRDKTKMALFVFDIDNFKRINDSLGHSAGDKVLVELANRLKKVLRKCDLFFRLGGDEFSIVVENYHSVYELKVLLKRIQHALRKAVVIEEMSLHISVSVGISLFPEHAEDLESLQKTADIAMYTAKKSGKNRFSFFAQERVDSVKVLELENELFDAIKNNELQTYLQPQVDLHTAKLLGAEALVRWDHPTRGVLAPFIFLQLAEEIGMLYKLDLLMIENVFSLLKRYKKMGKLDFKISVNISNALFHHNVFLVTMQEYQKQYPELISHIILELTENIVMIDDTSAYENIKFLKSLGYKMSIDDFGTGYSSLSHLKSMDIDELKIDRAFIRDISEDENDKAIVQAIVVMGHTLGLDVLAEGVETKEQLDILESINCDIIQGYYFDKPLSIEDFEKKWINRE